MISAISKKEDRELPGSAYQFDCELQNRSLLIVPMYTRLHVHWNKFKGNMGAYSKEQGKYFHQERRIIFRG